MTSRWRAGRATAQRIEPEPELGRAGGGVRAPGLDLGRAPALPRAGMCSAAVRERQPGDEALPSPAVGRDAAGDDKQPWQRAARWAVPGTPGGERPGERLRDDLLDIVAPTGHEDHVSRHVAVMRAVDRFERVGACLE